jgi:quercetin dioxygenase-like cupin family protein
VAHFPTDGVIKSPPADGIDATIDGRISVTGSLKLLYVIKSSRRCNMTLEVRRIVTGHNEFGMGIVVSDEKLSAVSRGLGANITGCEVWSTNSMPVDNSMEAEASQRAGFVKKYNYVGSGQGTTVRIVEWTPGHAMFWHRTETLDYSMVLSGEIDVEFDSGQVVTMKQGDIIVMRGVTHCWKNKSTVPAVTAFILIDAVPFEAAGEKSGVLFPA